MCPRGFFEEIILSLEIKKAMTRHLLSAHGLQFKLEGQPLLS